jgi:hypothetical protein
MIDYVVACGCSCTADSTATRGRVTRNPASRTLRSNSDAAGTPGNLARILG